METTNRTLAFLSCAAFGSKLDTVASTVPDRTPLIRADDPFRDTHWTDLICSSVMPACRIRAVITTCGSEPGEEMP
ncbi:hypothetical protein ACFPL5_22860, partial [Azospirillum rugosum]